MPQKPNRHVKERLFIHLLLLLGCVVFSLPFFWLLTTSFKADKEMFVLPPQWIPEIPQHVVKSPYRYTWRGVTTRQFFGLGDITVQDMSLSDLLVRSSASLWRVAESSGPVEASLDSFESRAILRVPYDFAADGNAASGRLALEATFRSPVRPQDLRRVEVTFKSDYSFHTLSAEITTPQGLWRAEDPAVLSTETWKSAPWQFTRIREEERSALPLVQAATLGGSPDANLQSQAQLGPDSVRVRVVLERSSWAEAIWRKYTDSYFEALSYIPFGRFMLNTVILTTLNIVLQLVSCSFIAYGFARIRWPGRNVVFAVLLATMMIPGQVVMIPQFLIWRGLGLYNTWGPLFLGSLFGSGFFIFLLRQFMLTVPRDLEDAAKIDGAGYLTVWRMVMLPLIKPALAAIAIFQFMGTWNDFFGPLIYVNSKNLMPISLGLYMFRDAHGAEYGMLMAASTVMVLPVVALFFFAQRYFIQGVTLTGLKG